jgi:hypothetical protein
VARQVRSVATGTCGGEPLYHASLDPDEYHMLIDAQGSEAVRPDGEAPAAGRHTIWIAGLR